jgi:hypothetical protein
MSVYLMSAFEFWLDFDFDFDFDFERDDYQM